MEILRPRDEAQLAEVITEANHQKMALEVAGAGTKRALGRPVDAERIVCTGAMFGVSLYEPEDLVVTVKTGTPVRFLEETLSRQGQMLGFEPLDLGPVLGQNPGEGTIGGLFATNLCGSRRLQVGSARDHLLGMTAVNGLGQQISVGGRVMKNVAGYDLTRNIAGSWGTLGVMTEVTMRVMPKPEDAATLIFYGLLDELAIELMAKAMKTPCEVSGAVHIQEPLVAGIGDEKLRRADTAITAIRIENQAASVEFRLKFLKDILDSFGPIEVLERDRSDKFWAEMRELKLMQNTDTPFWRITTAPSNGVDIVAAIKAHHPNSVAVYDWSGGLIWLLTPFTADAGASEVHRAVVNRGGNATLMRGELALRASADVFQPVEEGMAVLARKIKAAFDPNGILNPGRMYSYC
ncbi:MAG: FAD-binding protein [Methyloligellaceae bacterium]